MSLGSIPTLPMFAVPKLLSIVAKSEEASHSIICFFLFLLVAHLWHANYDNCFNMLQFYVCCIYVQCVMLYVFLCLIDHNAYLIIDRWLRHCANSKVLNWGLIMILVRWTICCQLYERALHYIVFFCYFSESRNQNWELLFNLQAYSISSFNLW